MPNPAAAFGLQGPLVEGAITTNPHGLGALDVDDGRPAVNGDHARLFRPKSDQLCIGVEKKKKAKTW